MKKLFILMLAGAMVLAITVPAMAEIEHIFGGYWRVRAFTQQSFSGEDTTEAQDLTRTDTRTRIYYTAKFSDNLKFVNKFEFNNVFGDSVGGDIGADGTGIFRIKNSYADFTLGPVRTTLGIQGHVLARGFIFDDDFSGAVVRWNADWGRVPFVWIKVVEGGSGLDANDQDVDIYGINPTFKISDSISLNPFFILWYSDDGSQFNALWDDVSLYYIGANADIKMDPFSLWVTGIYNAGEVDLAATGVSEDRNAFLLAGGAKTSIGPVGIHAEAFYASGDDDLADDDDEAFSVPGGHSYYWSEIMGYGIFDNQTSNNSPSNHPSNIFAGNIGFTYTLIENLKLKGDLWSAVLAEDNAAGEDYLGTELDIKATYKIMDNLNLDLVAAYLFAGDATEQDPNSADPYELGARISLSF